MAEAGRLLSLAHIKPAHTEVMKLSQVTNLMPPFFLVPSPWGLQMPPTGAPHPRLHQRNSNFNMEVAFVFIPFFPKQMNSSRYLEGPRNLFPPFPWEIKAR